VAAVVAIGLLAVSGPASGALARHVLKNRPFAPGDVEMFSTSVYPEGAPMAPAAGDAPTEEEVAAELDAYEQEQYPDDPDLQAAAENLFTNSQTVAKIPSPSLRAAFVALRGSLAQPAIDYILNHKTAMGNDEVTTVRFVAPGLMPDPTTAIGAVYSAGTGDPDQVEIRFNQRYDGEDPFLFAPIMGHEALHLGDQSNSNTEEQVATSFDGLLAIDELARHPELATIGTELARRINTRALVRLNSGLGSKLGLYATNGNALVFPGSTAATGHSWYEDTGGGEPSVSTPGFSLLGRYLDGIHTADTPLCSSADFSKTLLDCINQDGDAGLAPKAILAAATAMNLETGAADVACKDARTALHKARRHLRRLRRREATDDAIAKAKRRVKRAKAKVERVC
jgi:hypothetical protein